jgi:ubiquinone/menaquinone biosynthesis C-methylase UbiE
MKGSGGGTRQIRAGTVAISWRGGAARTTWGGSNGPTIAALLLVTTLAWACAAPANPAPPGVRFPTPDRPVAAIVSPEYSDEPTRDRHGEAERVLARLGIRPGVRVADIGAGLGYYTVRLARRLGPSATIYAQDVSPEYLAQLGARLRREDIRGVTLVQGTPDDPRLPAASIDVAILSHMYHEIANPFEFLYRLHAALAPGARVAIIDVDKRTQDHGTPPALLRCELGAVGYRQVDFTTLAPADGYLAVFAPPAALPSVGSIRACKQ